MVVCSKTGRLDIISVPTIDGFPQKSDFHRLLGRFLVEELLAILNGDV